MINRLIAQLADLEWSKVIMIGLGLVGVYYFLMFDSGETLQNRIKAATAHLADANTKLAQTKKAMENANRFEQEVKRIQQQFEQITNFMPMSIGPAELTQIVNQSAGLAAVKVTKIEPKGPDTRAGFYEASRVFVSIQGSFAQVLKFLEMISRVPKLLTFDSVKVSYVRSNSGAVSSESPPLMFEGLLVGYRYIKDAPYEEPKGGPGVPGVPKPPVGGGG